MKKFAVFAEPKEDLKDCEFAVRCYSLNMFDSQIEAERFAIEKASKYANDEKYIVSEVKTAYEKSKPEVIKVFESAIA